MAEKNKKKKNSFVDTLLGLLPAIVLSLVVFPILGYFSYAIYSNAILGSSNTFFNIIILLITIFMNLIVLLGLFYAVNIMWETDIRKHLAVGGVVLVIVVSLAIYRYSIYASAAKAMKESTDATGAAGILALSDFRIARAIAIGFTAYYVISIFINKIAQISVKNKGIRASK